MTRRGTAKTKTSRPFKLPPAANTRTLLVIPASGWGQLTGTGMSQHHVVGERLRKRYVYETGLLSTNYSRDEVLVRSTDYDRTMQSAQSQLMGLFPPSTGPSNMSGSEALPYWFQVPSTSTSLSIPLSFSV